MSKRKNKHQKLWQYTISLTLLICIIAIGYISQNIQNPNTNNTENIISNVKTSFDLSTIPDRKSVV